MIRFEPEGREYRSDLSVPRSEHDFRSGGAVADLLGVCRLLGQDLLNASAGATRPSAGRAIPVDAASGGFDLTTAATLRLAPRAGFDQSLYNHPVIVWGGSRQRVQIVRGEPVQVTRVGHAYTLSWSRGPLELQVPGALAGLELRAAGSDVRVHRFDGPIQADLFRGWLEIRGLRAPFRVRGLGTPVVLRECAVGAGESSVATTGGDIVVEFADAASLRVEAVSLGGWIESRLGPAWGDLNHQIHGVHGDLGSLPELGNRRGGAAKRSSPLERRTLCVGSGQGALRLDTAGGWIHLRGAPNPR